MQDYWLHYTSRWVYLKEYIKGISHFAILNNRPIWLPASIRVYPIFVRNQGDTLGEISSHGAVVQKGM